MLNLDRVGRPFIKVDDAKLGYPIISIDTDNDPKAKRKFNELNIGKEHKFQHIPNPKAGREVLYMAGPSGSGKSYYCKNFVKELKRVRKDYPVYLFSPFTEDESLDEIKPQRVKIDESLVTDPIHVKDLFNSCVIFDDIDSIKDKKIRFALRELEDQCLEIGRHNNVYVLVTNHLLCDNNNTKRILNEAQHIVFFPHSGSIATIRRLCESYGGIDNDILKRIRKTKSRWCCIHKNYPIVISTEHEVFCANGDSDDDDETIIKSKKKK